MCNLCNLYNPYNLCDFCNLYCTLQQAELGIQLRRCKACECCDRERQERRGLLFLQLLSYAVVRGGGGGAHLHLTNQLERMGGGPHPAGRGEEEGWNWVPACLPVPCHSKYRQMSAPALHPLARQLREIVWQRCLSTNLREGEGLTVSLRQGHAVACFACDDLDESEQAPRFATSLSNGEGSPSLTHGVVNFPLTCKRS